MRFFTIIPTLLKYSMAHGMRDSTSRATSPALSFDELARILAEEWENLPEEGKTPYRKKADEERLRHETMGAAMALTQVSDILYSSRERGEHPTANVQRSYAPSLTVNTAGRLKQNKKRRKRQRIPRGPLGVLLVMNIPGVKFSKLLVYL